jgi:hypothetical protein
MYELNDLPSSIADLISVSARTGCWLWGGRLSPSGYGTIYWDKRNRVVHRVVYTLLAGPIPQGLVLDHVHARGCRFKRCCWPVHLEPVTIAENNRRRVPLAPLFVDARSLPTIAALAEIMV